MFLKTKRSGYDRDGEQFTTGLFLILLSNESNELRAIARQTSLRPLGHFMMGHARIGKYSISLSGAYGSDGLPHSVHLPSDNGIAAYLYKEDWKRDSYIWNQAIPVDPDVAKIFWSDNTGWNDAGISGNDVRKWALANLHRLVPKRSKYAKRATTK